MSNLIDNPDQIVDSGAASNNKALSAQIGAPFGLPQEKLVGISVNPDAGEPQAILDGMTGGTSDYMFGASTWTHPSDEIRDDANKFIAAMGQKQNMSKDGLPVSLNEISTNLGLTDAWERNRGTLKGNVLVPINDETLKNLDRYGIGAANFGGDEALFADFKASLNRLSTTAANNKRLMAAINIQTMQGDLSSAISISIGHAGGEDWGSGYWKKGSKFTGRSFRAIEVPIPNQAGMYSVGGSETPVKRFIGYDNKPKSNSSLAISAIVEYDRNIDFYDSKGKLNHKAIGQNVPELFTEWFGQDANLEDFKGFLKSVNLANVNRFRGISERKPEKETVFHRLYKTMAGGTNVEVWGGGEMFNIDVNSPSAAYSFMNQSDVLSSRIFGMDELAQRQRMMSMGKHGAGRGYVRIPGIQYSGPGVTNELMMNMSPFPVMDAAKRNQLAVAELGFTDETLNRFGSVVKFDPRLGGATGRLPLLKLRSYHTTPESYKATLRTYMGGKFNAIAPFEDTGVVSTAIHDVEYAFDQSYNILNTKGMPVRGVGGRSMVESVSSYALDTVADRTGRTFSATERAAFAKVVGSGINDSRLSVNSAIRQAVRSGDYGVEGDSVANEAFARMHNALKQETKTTSSLFGFAGARTKAGYKSAPVAINMDTFNITDIRFPGGLDDSYMTLVGKERKAWNPHSKGTGSEKFTQAGKMSPVDMGRTAAMDMRIREIQIERGVTADAAAKMLTSEDMAAIYVNAVQYQDIMRVGFEGKLGGGLSKGIADLDLEKDIKPDGKYSFANLTKSTKVLEDLDSAVEQIARLDLGELEKQLPGSTARLRATLGKLGFGLGAKGDVTALGGLNELNAAPAGSILDIARAEPGFAGFDFSTRRQIEALYASEYASMKGIKVGDSKARVMDIAHTAPSNEDLGALTARVNAIMSEQSGDNLSRMASARTSRFHDVLMSHEMAGTLPHVIELNNFMNDVGLGNIRYNMYNVKDEESSLRYTSEKATTKKKFFYQAEKGLLDARQMAAFDAFKASGQLPEDLARQISYIFAGVGAEKSALITGGEILNALDFDNMPEGRKAFLTKVAGSLDKSLGLSAATEAEAFELMKARYGVSAGSETNARNTARFMSEIMMHPDVGVRREIYGELFDGKSLLATSPKNFKVGGGLEDVFSTFADGGGFSEAFFTMGDPNSKYHKEVMGNSEFRANYKQYIKSLKNKKTGKSEANLYSTGMSMFPEDYGYGAERIKIGAGEVASYEAEDMQAAMRKTLEALTGHTQMGGEYIKATPWQIEAQTFNKLFTYGLSASLSKSKDNKIIEMLGSDSKTIMGQAGVSDVTKVTRYSQMLDQGVSAFLDEEASITQMIGSNKLALESGQQIPYTYKMMQEFREGAPIIGLGLRNPFAVSSRQAALQIFSGKAYGANFQDGQRVALYHGEGMSKEYSKAFEAFLNLDMDGDKVEATFAKSAEMRQKMELMFQMQNASMTKAIEIRQSTGQRMGLQEVLDQIKGSMDGIDAPEELKSLHASESFWRIGLTGGRKKVREIKEVGAWPNAREAHKKIIDLFDEKVGEITNVGNVLSTILKSNPGEFRDVIKAKTGLTLNDTEIRSLWDHINEQFLESPANVKNTYKPDELLRRSNILLENFGNIKDYTNEAKREAKKSGLTDSALTIEENRINAQMRKGSISKAMNSYLDVVSYALSPLTEDSAEGVDSDIRRVVGQLVSKDAGSGPSGFAELNRVTEGFIQRKSTAELISPADALYMMAEQEGKKGFRATGGDPIRNLLQDAVEQNIAQPSLAANTIIASRLGKAAQGITQGGPVIQSMAANSVTSGTTSGSATQATEAAHAAVNKAAHTGGTLIDEFSTGNLEDRLIRMLESKDGQIVKNMKTGGYIGAGIFAAVAVGSAIFNNVFGHGDIENDDKGSARAIATASRENKAIAGDSTSYAGPVRVTDNPGMYNYNSVSRANSYRAMRGVSQADIINGAGSSSNVNIVNEVSKGQIESAIGENYGKDSY